ncbi:MAG: hypothetical protein GDA50_08350 [Alphaproteobacteria bacterium GM202ARS2]|nr:hypothetical protein [Alphaproteobacteria bacterium GM202ARS2]
MKTEILGLPQRLTGDRRLAHAERKARTAEQTGRSLRHHADFCQGQRQRHPDQRRRQSAKNKRLDHWSPNEN